MLRIEERLERGELEIQIRSIETERLLKKVNLGIKSLVYLILLGFTTSIGVLLLLFGNGNYDGWIILLFILSAFSLISFLRFIFSLSLRERLDKFAED